MSTRGTKADAAGDLPDDFLARLDQLLPPGAIEHWWRAFRAEPATGFRVNTLRARPEAVLQELAAAAICPQPLSWWPLGYTIPAAQRRRLTETAAFASGRVYVQNPSSMLPPLLLVPSPGDRVLDLGAAPGSKTLQLAAMMENRGSIAAVERVRARFFRLRRNVELSGATNVQTYLRDGASVWRSCPEQFDCVLLDAPCSGEGRFSLQEPRSYAYWSLRKIREMVRTQRRLIFSAVNSLRPGGVLVYATCTLAPEENEGVCTWALQRFGDALAVEAVDLALPNLSPGLRHWGNHEMAPAVTAAQRVLPDGTMQGFFLCRLRKHRSTLAP